MPLLVIDHSAVSVEKWWPALQAVTINPGTQLALSVWNLVEIGFATDKAQQRKRIAFLTELKPVWLYERLHILKAEVDRFLGQNYFQVQPKEFSPVTPHLSAVDHELTRMLPRIGISPQQFVDQFDYPLLQREKKLAPSALRTLQSAEPEKLKEIEKQMFDAWIWASFRTLIRTGGCSRELRKMNCWPIAGKIEMPFCKLAPR